MKEYSRRLIDLVLCGRYGMERPKLRSEGQIDVVSSFVKRLSGRLERKRGYLIHLDTFNDTEKCVDYQVSRTQFTMSSN
jgi:hypothetical protein